MLLNVQLQLTTFLTTYIFVLFWNGLSATGIQPPDIKVLKPRGLKFTIKDDGYSLVNIQYNINRRIRRREDIQWENYMSKTGNLWEHVNQNVTVEQGDKIYYEISGRKGAYGENELLRADMYKIPKHKDNYEDGQSKDSSNEDDDDSEDDIVFIVIGVVLGLVLTACLVFLLWYCIRKKRMTSEKRHRKANKRQPSENNNERKRKEIEAEIASDSLKSNCYTSNENRLEGIGHSQDVHTYEYINPAEINIQDENKDQGYLGLSQTKKTKTENESYDKLRQPQYLELIG